jgi:hypothetical protein
MRYLAILVFVLESNLADRVPQGSPERLRYLPEMLGRAARSTRRAWRTLDFVDLQCILYEFREGFQRYNFKKAGWLPPVLVGRHSVSSSRSRRYSST